MDPFSLSVCESDGRTVWGDNGEPGWWPVSVGQDGQCLAVVLSRPVRLARHPVAVTSSSPVAVLCRAAQLALHRAVLARQSPLPGSSLSPALSLFCLARVARRLDPLPHWSSLLLSPLESMERALSLSPHLASLLLPIVLHQCEPPLALALASRLLLLQLRLGLFVDAADTLRFAFRGRVDSPPLASHFRALRVHARPLALLRLALLLEEHDSSALALASAAYCEPLPLSFWDELLAPLAASLGLGAPVLVESSLRLPMSGAARALLSRLVEKSVAAPLRLAGAFLLLRPVEAAEALATMPSKAVLENAPASWMPFVQMLKK